MREECPLPPALNVEIHSPYMARHHPPFLLFLYNSLTLSTQGACSSSNDQTWFAMGVQFVEILPPIPPRKPSRLQWYRIDVIGYSRPVYVCSAELRLRLSQILKG